MKTAIYPGTFNPWHAGHNDVLLQALKAFDKIIVWQGYNSTKDNKDFQLIGTQVFDTDRVEVVHSSMMLADYLKTKKVDAVIKGLRNPNDLIYEQTQQYWNEDLGVSIPTFYVISDRKLVHISSSAIRAVRSIK